MTSVQRSERSVPRAAERGAELRERTTLRGPSTEAHRVPSTTGRSSVFSHSERSETPVVRDSGTKDADEGHVGEPPTVRRVGPATIFSDRKERPRATGHDGTDRPAPAVDRPREPIRTDEGSRTVTVPRAGGVFTVEGRDKRSGATSGDRRVRLPGSDTADGDKASTGLGTRLPGEPGRIFDGGTRSTGGETLRQRSDRELAEARTRLGRNEGTVRHDMNDMLQPEDAGSLLSPAARARAQQFEKRATARPRPVLLTRRASHVPVGGSFSNHHTSVSIGVTIGQPAVWVPVHRHHPPIVYHPVISPFIYQPIIHRPIICQPVIVRPWWTYGCPSWYWPYNGWSIGYHGRKWSLFFGDIWPTRTYVETVYVESEPVVVERVVYEPAPVRVVDRYGDIDKLIDKLKYGDVDQRKDAAKELGYTHSFKALYPLVYAVEYDSEPLVRHYAAKALGKLGFRDALPALRKVADQDPEEVVRAEAQDSIDRILERPDQTGS